MTPALRPAAYAPFRAHRARLVGVPVAVAMVVVLVAVALALPGYGVGDRGLFVAFGVLTAAVVLRLVTVHATPAPGGLVVRNVVYRRHLDWAEIVDVRFGGGNPWVLLDLADGESLAVMGIQRADGARAVAESRRLAALVEHHSRTERDD